MTGVVYWTEQQWGDCKGCLTLSYERKGAHGRAIIVNCCVIKIDESRLERNVEVHVGWAFVNGIRQVALDLLGRGIVPCVARA